MNPSTASRKLLSSIDVSDFGSTRVMPSVCDRPNEQNRMMSVNGVLRTTLTYAVPIQLSIGTGESRIAASSVPRMSAPMAEYTVNWIVVQNASNIWLWYLVNSSTSGCDRLLVERRWSRRGDACRPEVLVERRLPRPVLHHLGDRVVDLGPQVGVAL